MINYTKPLWLLFLGQLLSGATIILSGGFETAAQLVGGILSIFALVQLAPRNLHLAKARTYMIAIYALSLVMLFGTVVFQGWLTVIGGGIAMLVLALLFAYRLLHGLADMAEEAGNAKHAQKLREFFTITLIVSVASLVTSLVSPLLSLGSVVLVIIFSIAVMAVTAYRVYLIYGSMKIEEAFVGRAL